jgi:hypothetical protein
MDHSTMSAITGCSVWLYGSFAPGDADAMSDVDLLVVGEWAAPECLLPEPLRHFPRSVSSYELAEIEAMAECGSLFLRHIAAEGRPLHRTGQIGESVERLLAVLPPYRGARRDVRGFRLALRDIEESLSHDGVLSYELAVLAGMLRHAAVLVTHLSGATQFGRLDAWKASLVTLDVEGPTDFESLYAFRLSLDGRGPVPVALSGDTVDSWMRFAHSYINALDALVEVGDGQIRRAS